MTKNMYFFTKVPFSAHVFAAEEIKKTYYAKVEKSDVYFFNQPNDIDGAKVFILPKSYFVLLLDSASPDFFYCSYGEKFGYVKKDDVTPMSGLPQTPYATSTKITISNFGGFPLLPAPQEFSEYSTFPLLPMLGEDVVFYGLMKGDSLLPDKDNLWYYVCYQDMFGYVYSQYCYPYSLQENNEIFDKIDGELFPNPLTSPSSHLSDTAKTFIIIAVSLPCVLILYLLIKPTIIMEKSEKKRKKIAKNKKRSDYFEFDEHDLT